MRINLKQLLETGSKLLSGAVAYVTLDSYVRSIKDNRILDRYLIEKAKNEKLSAELHAKSRINDKLEIADLKFNHYEDKLKINCNSVTHELQRIKDINSKLKENNLSHSDISQLNNDLAHHTSNVTNEISDSNKILSEIKTIVDQLINSGSGSSTNNKFISEYKLELDNYLASLTTEELGALGHISVSLFILFCLFSIIVIYYSEFLIIKLKIEEKYPKLAKFIQLRRKFQQYYFLLNICLIILALLFVIYINFIVLFY